MAKDDDMEICFDWRGAVNGRGLDDEWVKLEYGIVDAFKTAYAMDSMTRKGVVNAMESDVELIHVAKDGTRRKLEVKMIGNTPHIELEGDMDWKREDKILVESGIICVKTKRGLMEQLLRYNYSDTIIPDIFAQAHVKDIGLGGLKLANAAKIELKTGFKK